MSTDNERDSKMSFLTKLYSIKCKRGASDACMSDVLDLLTDALREETSDKDGVKLHQN